MTASIPRPPDAGLPSPLEDVERFRGALLDFFAERARPLPWRATDDPYAIWVSEIMLQQTRVETVIPYWERWMARFPTVAALADADEAEVLKAWEGLGYYSRARNLRRGAIVVRERFGGEMPAEPQALREVPGVGAYTAGAVASIAFGVVAPAVDGNARRVLARLFDEAEPRPAWLRDRATELVDPERPGDFNEALIELGATVCTPRSPGCAGCPVAVSCAARVAGTVGERPAPKRARAVPERAFVVRVEVVGGGEADGGEPDGGEPGGGKPGGGKPGGGGRWKVRMRRRPSEGLLGGLWEFPAREIVGAAGGADPPGEAIGDIEGEPLAPVTHAFSHFRATYRPFARRVESIPAGAESPGAEPAGADRDGADERWIALEDLADLALPVAQRKIAGSVAEWLAASGHAR
ncbi:MAG: A/G-specific adenine glycosylase [Longimicrobiales bacterium]|nr:A/G-specific adenine glycosylase [Longimicrobiales bacterium]